MESHNLSCEPMDIDLSNHSIKEMDISYNESDDVKTFLKTDKSDVFKKEFKQTSYTKIPHGNVIPYVGVKKYRIQMHRAEKSSKSFVFHILVPGIIIAVSIFTFYICSLKCCEDFNLEVLSDTLSSKLVGQSEAINMLINTLKLKEGSKLLFFSGGTGVGKTFASSILLDTMGSCSNVYHYTMPSFTKTFSTEFMLGLTMCKMSLFIVDDLTVNDMYVKAQIKELIEKSEHLKRNITVILIYNCYESTKDFITRCDPSFQKRLLNRFTEVKALKTFVEFKPLSVTHLKECVKQELGSRTLDDLEFDEILKNFNVTVDGCKGVHSKIKYLNIV